MPEARIAFQPFADQLAFFRRKVNVPTARWDDLRLGDHAHGFMVAGLARADVLNDMREAIVKAIEGETLEDFRARFDDLVRGRWEGFTGDGSVKGRAWRTRIIYRTNLRTSYMAGRWETLRKFAFLRYNHHTILNPREQHVRWDNLVIAINDPWWDTNYPPNGWGCNCDATGVSEQRLRAMGRTPDAAPPTIRGDPPPEWNYHVGKAARSLPVAAAFGERVMQLPPEWRDIALADAQRRRVDWFGDWTALMRDVLGSLDAGAARPTGVATPIGYLTSAVIDRLAAGAGTAGPSFKPVSVTTSLVAVDDRAFFHALRDSKTAGRPGIRDEFAAALVDLPEWLGSVDAVLWDSADASPALVYAKRDGSNYLVLIVRPDMTTRVAQGKVKASWVRTIERKPREVLARMSLLEGAL